jgi:hypothetical protein
MLLGAITGRFLASCKIRLGKKCAFVKKATCSVTGSKLVPFRLIDDDNKMNRKLQPGELAKAL